MSRMSRTLEVLRALAGAALAGSLLALALGVDPVAIALAGGALGVYGAAIIVTYATPRSQFTRPLAQRSLRGAWPDLRRGS